MTSCSSVSRPRTAFRATLDSARSDKSSIARQVVYAVHAYHGRFLRQLDSHSAVAFDAGTGDRNTVVWEIVDDSVVVEIVKQAMHCIQQTEANANKKPPAARLAKADSDVSGANSLRRSKMPRAFTNPVWHAKRPKLECSVTSHKQPGLKGNSWYSTPKHCALAERTAYAALTTTDRMSPKATRLLSASSQESTRLVKSRHLYGYLDRSNAQMPASGTRQCTTGSSGILPATGLLDKSTQNQVAILWREIPQTYLDLLPLVVKGRILPFCSIDLPTLDASLGRRCSRHLLFGDDSYRRGGRSRFAAAKTVFERRRNQVFGSSHERYCRVGMTFSLTLQMSRA